MNIKHVWNIFQGKGKHIGNTMHENQMLIFTELKFYHP